MVGTSHEKNDFNGVKIIERDGSMLKSDWEQILHLVINSPIFLETLQNLNEIWIKGFLFGKVNMLAYEKSPDITNFAQQP